MSSPLPGMDPYLERQWRDVHHRLCTYACDALQPQVRPQLLARLDEQLIVGSEGWPDRSVHPDVAVSENRSGAAVLAGSSVGLAVPLLLSFGDEPQTEGFVQILDPANGNALVTAIEFLSAANKTRGGGREQY